MKHYKPEGRSRSKSLRALAQRARAARARVRARAKLTLRPTHFSARARAFARIRASFARTISQELIKQFLVNYTFFIMDM